MKNPYSTYTSKNHWTEFKRLFPAKTERDYCEFASFFLETMCDKIKKNPEHCKQMLCPAYGRNVTDDDLFSEQEFAYAQLLFIFLWKFRKVTHYFLAPGVADFCVSSVKELSEDYCKRLPFCAPVDAPCAQEKWTFVTPLACFGKGPANKVHGGFAIHFPAKECQRSVMVIPNIILPVSLIANPDIRYGKIYYCAGSDGDNITLLQPNGMNMDFLDEGSEWLNKVIFGLSLYMDAFPDAVIEAGTENVHQIKHYEGARHIVNRNKIVDEEHRHSSNPHWRRGHFRLLQAEKFVHKRGQTVYVRGTFVKGRAFDVLDDAPGSASY